MSLNNVRSASAGTSITSEKIICGFGSTVRKSCHSAPLTLQKWLGLLQNATASLCENNLQISGFSEYIHFGFAPSIAITITAPSVTITSSAASCSSSGDFSSDDKFSKCFLLTYFTCVATYT